MRLINKHLLLSCRDPFLFGLAVITFLLMIETLFNYVDLFVTKGVPFSIATQVLLLSLPHTFALSIPMSVLVGVLMGVGQLAADNEITAMKASGISLWAILRPLLAGAAVIAVGLTAYNHFFFPGMNHTLANLLRDIHQKRPMLEIQPQQFNDLNDKMTIFVARKDDKTGHIEDVTIIEKEKPGDISPRMTFAAWGTIIHDHAANALILELHDGETHEQQSADEPGKYQVIRFAQLTRVISNAEQDLQKTDRKAIYMMPQFPLRNQEAKNFKFFLSIPETDPSLFNIGTTKGSQLVKPLFEFSGACAGCGETPYVKLVSQLFGDRALIGNATGCSSIYGGNLPTTPYTIREDGRGPAWSNSLFEDAAEFAMGMRLATDRLNIHALELLQRLSPEDFDAIAGADQSTQAGIEEQRARVEKLRGKLKGMDTPEASRLLDISDYLVKKSVWAFGGDGWAYDIGYGGLDHVMASGRNVNVLVLDTEVYSNTGGQMSKASPMGAVAKFAAAGRPLPKKDLGMMFISYGNVYVAQIALGASHNQAVKAFMEAEAYDGPSIIIAYSHCIAHGVDMSHGLDEQKKAVNSGHWILYRYNPELAKEGKNPLQLDSKAPSISYADYAYGEVRFRTLKASMPERAEKLIKQAQADVYRHYNYYKMLSEMDFSDIYGRSTK